MRLQQSFWVYFLFGGFFLNNFSRLTRNKKFVCLQSTYLSGLIFYIFFKGENMRKVTLEVNGRKVEKEVPDNTLLSAFLREHLNLTGTHIGCDTSQCGACVVHVNGNSLKSCTALAADVDGSKVTTIEGLATNGKMHPMQEAFKKLHGLQCGFCTPGMVMSAVDLLQKNKKPSDTEIRDWLEGNICRCTGYQNIVAAVKEAATKM